MPPEIDSWLSADELLPDVSPETEQRYPPDPPPPPATKPLGPLLPPAPPPAITRYSTDDGYFVPI
jgi:hypothetical protein